MLLCQCGSAVVKGFIVNPHYISFLVIRKEKPVEVASRLVFRFCLYGELGCAEYFDLDVFNLFMAEPVNLVQ